MQKRFHFCALFQHHPGEPGVQTVFPVAAVDQFAFPVGVKIDIKSAHVARQFVPFMAVVYGFTSF